MWDHDSGLVGYCDYIPTLAILDGFDSHELDNERSALLVSAPVSNGSINPDPNAYSALSLFTAAHEDTFTDHSAYYDFFTSPKPAGTHTDLWLSLSKHSTYPFNPDGEPTTPDDVIIATFTGIGIWGIYLIDTCDPFDEILDGDFTCMMDFEIYAALDNIAFDAALYYAVTVFYGCAVERFIEPGIVTTANVRINIGEPGLDGSGRQPINGSHFIQDDSDRALRIYSKLVTPLRFESSIP